MLAKTLACAVVDLEGALVEVDIGPGLPAFNIVGLPDGAVQEAKEPSRCGQELRLRLSCQVEYREPGHL